MFTFVPFLLLAFSQNHDTILMVDMSLSLVVQDPNPPHTPASDPNGLHWDGIDFIVNSSEPGDRIALVVYRTNPVLTSRFITGFDDYIQVDRIYDVNGERLTGRDWLKRLVVELRDFEKACASDPTASGTKWLKTNLINPPTILAHGTASLLALKSVGESGLLGQSTGRQCWAMLFTDGFEQPVFDTDILNGNLKGFEAIKPAAIKFPVNLNVAKQDGDLKTFLSEFIGEFRRNGVPLITFGLGDQCDRELLGQLALESGLIGNKSGGFYPATNNIVMFDTMRNVQWELRERWVKNWVRKIPNIGAGFQFDIHPDFSNVGFYCYKVGADGIAEAIDPSKGPFSLKNGSGLIAPELVGSFSCRSHWYYSFGVGKGENIQGITAPDQIFLDVGQVQGQVQGFLGIQTAGSLFTPINPAGDRPYSPKDSIPFELEFNNFSNQIRPDHFKVTARLVHSDDVKNKDSKREYSLSLVPVNDKSLGKVVFRANWTPDPDPKSKGDQDPANRKLLGTWFCDYSIEGIARQDAPLAGYKRTLIRRSFQVGAYKGFSGTGAEFLLSNSNPKQYSSSTKLKLNLGYPGPLGIAEPAISLDVPSAIAWAKAIKETHSTTNFSMGELDIILRIPEDSFNDIPVGRHQVGHLVCKLPWGPLVRLPITVKKEMFDLAVDDNQLVLDLSGKDAGGSFFVTLQSDGDIREKIRFSSQATTDKEKNKVRFNNVSSKDSKDGCEFEIKGLGNEIELVGGKRKPIELSLSRLENAKIKPGNYQADFVLQGKNTARKNLKIAAIIDYPSFEVDNKSVSEVFMPALAGGSTGFKFSFRSQLNRRITFEKENVKITRGVHSDIQDELLPKPSIDVKENQAKIGFKIPHTVFPGIFRTDLKSSLVQEKIALDYPAIPVSIRVYQAGVTTPSNLPIRLEKPESGYVYSGNFRLETPVTEMPVRWKLAKLKPENLPAFEIDRLEVRLDGKRIDNQSETVANPITNKRPLDLAFSVNTRGMSPGIYHGLLRINTLDFETEKEAGTTLDIPLVISIQGRDMVLDLENGKIPAARVQVRCFNTQKMAGNLTYDGKNLPWNDSNLIGEPSGIEDKKTGSRTFTYKVQLDGLKPGLTKIKASLPNGDPRNPQTIELVSEVIRDGSLQCEPRGCKLNDIAVLNLQISPETRRVIAGQELKVVATKAGSKEPPVEIVLKDNGTEKDIQAEDNIFTGTFEVKETGEYRFKFIPPANWPKAFAVKGTDLACVFTMETQPGDAGKLIYGGGMIASLFGIHGELREPKRVTIKNIHQTEAKWRATVLYPKNITDSKDILNREAETLPVTQYDGRIHMDCRLIVDPPEIGRPDTDGPQAVWEGTLPVGQELDIGLLATLSKEAEGIVFSDPMSVDDPENKGQKIPLTTHEGLDEANGVIIQLVLDYDLGPDSNLEVNRFSRMVRVPLAFRTEPWSKRGWMLTGVMSLAGVVFAIFGYRWWTTEGEDKKKGGDRVLEWFSKKFGSKAPPRGRGRQRLNRG